MKRFSSKFKKISDGYWLRYGLLAVVLFTSGFQISCPPPESLEGIDTDFNPAFHDGPNSGSSFNPPIIKAVAVDQRTGNIFVGGSFDMIDNVPAVNIAFYDKTKGSFFRLFGKGLRTTTQFYSGSVNALSISGNYLYVGGEFAQTAANPPVTGMNNLARYYIGSGSLEEVKAGFFSPVDRNGLNGTVYALEMFDDDLYVGGSFSNVVGLPQVIGLSNIGRYENAASCNSNCWSAVHSGFNSTVYALEKGILGNQAGDILYIGGEFTALNGSMLVAKRFTAYRPIDGAMLEFPGLNGTVKALAYIPSTFSIYAGGSFTQNDDNNLELNRIAYYPGGVDWRALPENGLNGDVNALVRSENLVFVGGDFTQTQAATPTALSRVASYDSTPDQQTWTPFASGLNDSVLAMGIDNIGNPPFKLLIAGGRFTRNGANLGEYLKRLVAFDFFAGVPEVAAKGAVSASDPKPLGLLSTKALNNSIATLASDTNGNVYAGGVFTATLSGTTILNRIGRYHHPTKTWSPLANGGLNGNVEAIVRVGDNLFVAGLFTATADGAITNLNRVARYNLTTNTWSQLANSGLNGNSNAMVVHGDSLYVGGSFTRTFDNVVTNLNRIARYDLLTNTWSPLANNGLNADVNALAIAGDDLYIGGGFTRTFDMAFDVLRITRYNITNQTWFQFANSGLNSEPNRLMVLGNDLFVNGFFTRTWDNTIILDGLGRYDITNNTWAMMPGNAESRLAAQQTNAMVQVGNELFIGGNFHGTGDAVSHFFAHIYLQKWAVPAPTSDWFNSANWTTNAVPAPNTNAAIPAGAGNIQINSADVVMNDLMLNGGTLTIGVGRTLTINGILGLNGGSINGDGNLVITNCQQEGIMGGGSTSYIQTTLVRCVAPGETFNFEVGTPNGYAPVTIKDITGTGNISVKANQGAYSGPAMYLPVNRLTRWWQIENPGGGVTNSEVIFSYLEGDIVGNEASYRAYRISGGSASVFNSTVNTFSNRVTVPNVTGYSDWTLADFGPSAGNVAVGGRVLAANGSGINKAVVTLTDQNSNVRRAITNSFGYFRFDDVEVGQTYVLTVRNKRYIFDEPSRIVSLKGDALDLDFVALP